MAESAEDIVFRRQWRRLHEDLIENHPDERIREVALEVMKGTYTWSEAMSSGTYGDAVDAMAAGPGDDEGTDRDWQAEAREITARMVEDVKRYGEIALDDPAVGER